MSIIEVDHVLKVFRRTSNGEARTLRAMASGQRLKSVGALRDVSLTVERGESLALIGRNGSGKSTLLRIIAQLTKPTSGTVKVRGTVNALLLVGQGIEPMLSGEENAYTSALLSGLSRSDARRNIAAIAGFAELEDVMDRPVRTYSDGMRMRLAFAAAIMSRPDILLVDEVLAVGDVSFQAKCLSRIRDMVANGTSVVTVSHFAGLVTQIAHRAIWLEEGRVHLAGEAEFVAERYQTAMMESAPTAVRDASGQLRLGEHKEIEIIGSRIADSTSGTAQKIRAGKPCEVAIDYRCHAREVKVTASIAIHRESDGNQPLDLSSEHDDVGIVCKRGDGSIVLELQRLDLAAGTYFVNVGLFSPGFGQIHDYQWRAVPFEVFGPSASGPVSPPRRWIAERP
jgi:lipopolysaccharide transport system ATP-binding protein